MSPTRPPPMHLPPFSRYLARRATPLGRDYEGNNLPPFFWGGVFGVPALLRPEFGPALQVPQCTPQSPQCHPCTRLATHVAAPLILLLLAQAAETRFLCRMGIRFAPGEALGSDWSR